MKLTTEHRLVREYLSRFDRAAVALPRARRAELRQEIAAHLRDSIPADLPDGAAEMVIANFGTPEEILGQEPVPRVRQIPRRFWVIVSALLAAAVVAAVVLAPEPITSKVNAHPEGPDRVTTGVAYAEYKAEITLLPPLPPGAEYPIGIPAGLDAGPTGPLPDAEEGVMESGAGRWTARFTWLCAWELEYIGAFKAEEMDRRVAAEAALEHFAEADYYGDDGWELAVLGPMRLGDPSAIMRDAPSTCDAAYIKRVLRD